MRGMKMLMKSKPFHLHCRTTLQDLVGKHRIIVVAKVGTFWEELSDVVCDTLSLKLRNALIDSHFRNNDPGTEI